LATQISVIATDKLLTKEPRMVFALPLFQREDDSWSNMPSAFGSYGEQGVAERFTGKRGETLLLPAGDEMTSEKILLVGLGPQGKWSTEDIRGAVVSASECANKRGMKRMVFCLQHMGPVNDRLVHFAAQGGFLSAYRFNRYQFEPKALELMQIDLLVEQLEPGLLTTVDESRVLADWICEARDWVNEPANVCTPSYLAEQARMLAKRFKLDVEIVQDTAVLRERSMGLFAAVTQGSSEPPALIHLIYRNGNPGDRRYAFVGKGVTYDSGGYSMKSSEGQIGMHGDMAGGAAVLASAGAISELGVKDVEIHFIVPCAENLVSGKAYKVNDLIKAHNGKVVEIGNTDAEGRLLLADALSYACDQGVSQVIDLATLTGGCVVALGGVYAGVMGNDGGLVENVLESGEKAGELLWQLPLAERLREKLKSRVAHLKNTGGRWGSAITAGLFLSEFVGETPWVHLDIAGVSDQEKQFEHLPAGATGFGVATLVDFVR
jgi:leucyl aminopeptidase